MSEQVDQGLYGALSGSADVGALVGDRIYQLEAPENDPFPRIVFQEVTSPEAHTYGGRAYTRHTYQVKAVDRGNDQGPAKQTLAAVDGALFDQELSIGGLLLCRRTNTLSTVERTDGEVYVNAIAEYLLIVEEG